MDSVEKKFLEEFKSRHSYDQEDPAWIQAALHVLGGCLSSHENGLDKAASVLADSKWSNEGLNVLAYASFCFWHRPLAVPEYLFTFGMNADWMINGLMSALICKEDLHPKSQIILNKTNDQMKLACVALKARSLRASKGESAWLFQAKLLQEVPQLLEGMPCFKKVAKKWPDCKAIRAENEKNPSEPTSLKKAFSDVGIDLITVSEEAAKVLCQVADEFFPDDFGGISCVRAVFPEAGKHKAGGYNYSNGSGYLVIPDTFWLSMDTLPAFLAFTAHEVLHMHQQRSIERNPDISSPFYAEHLTRKTDMKASDFSCMTYSIEGMHARSAKTASLAYAYRPQEFLAYQFDGAFQKVLAQKYFKAPFIKPWFDAGYDAFAKAAGVEVEPDQQEKSVPLPPARNNQRQKMVLNRG